MKTAIWIKLVIETTEEADAFAVVDELLDQGAIQELVNAHDLEGYAEMRVTEATCEGEGGG